MFMRFWKDESGATAIEYALIGALISVSVVTGATMLGTTLNAKFDSIATTVGTGL
jgi:pilus assembly protein Flp/PilA